MEQKRINIAMVGYKFMGKVHSHAYRDLPFYFGTEHAPVLHTIVGRNPAEAERAARSFGWRHVATDWRVLLENDDIDVIDIGTPNDSHAEIAVAAAAAGKHILCEKPLAMNLKQAKDMRDAVRKHRVVNMISHCYRFAPAVQLAKRLIEEGRLGDIYHVRATYLQDWAMSPAHPLVWRFQKKHSGSGTNGDLMSHLIDMARLLVGEVTEVCGMLETFVKQRPIDGHTDAAKVFGEVDVDDAAACMCRFDNGAMGVFESTRFGKGNRNGNRMEINGSKGSIRWDLENMNFLQVYLENDDSLVKGFRTINCTEPEHPYGKIYWPPGHSIGYEHLFINLIHEFMNGIRTGFSPSPNFEDGYRTQAVLSAIEASAQSGCRQSIAVEED